MKTTRKAKPASPRTNRTTEKPLAVIENEIFEFWNEKLGEHWSCDSVFRSTVTLSGWFKKFSELRSPVRGLSVYSSLSMVWTTGGSKYMSTWRHETGGRWTTVAFLADTPEEAMTRLYHAAIQAGCTVAGTTSPAAVKAVSRKKSSSKISKVKRKVRKS